MARLFKRNAYAMAILGLWAMAWSVQAADDPLPAWNDGSKKQALVDFVTTVTTGGGPDDVAAERTGL